MEQTQTSEKEPKRRKLGDAQLKVLIFVSEGSANAVPVSAITEFKEQTDAIFAEMSAKFQTLATTFHNSTGGPAHVLIESNEWFQRRVAPRSSTRT